MGDKFTLVTPGIRPVESSKNDQSRIATPSEAIKLGADYLVIGRPITMAKDPAKALSDIHKSINSA
jgi:orotidine-5'-phosphate decarboxylase